MTYSSKNIYESCCWGESDDGDSYYVVDEDIMGDHIYLCINTANGSLGTHKCTNVIKEELKNKMEEYIKEVFLEEKKAIKDERECVIFAGNLLDFNLMGYSEKYIIELIEKILQVMKSVKNRRFDTTLKNDIKYYLDKWTREIFLKLDPEKVTEEQIDLYIYSALLKIKYRTYSFDVKNACDDLENAMNNYSSQKAKQYLEKGSGTLADELIHYKDKDLECKANDILSIVDIKIKNEVASSYEKALDFIIALLSNGFPHSYSIKFSSKSEKVFLDIKGLAKSSTHRFFRRILDFPELYDKLEVYAKTAMKEFEWYQDVEEGEKSLLPGSYAVFALGLYDEKYFPLIKEYYSKLDDEHQLAHQHFITALIDRYGVTEKSLHTIFEGFLSGQFDKIFKNFEIVKGSNSDVKKFSKTSDYLPFELSSLAISKDNNLDVIIPDESVNPSFDLH